MASHNTVEEQRKHVIAVMGMTGAGKSTFIQRASGRDDVIIGEDLESCTQTPMPYDFPHGDRSVELIDTPGFDDTYRSDSVVLMEIAEYLAVTYQDGVKLCGIVYLHDITKNRMTHGGMRNLEMFKELCGDEPLPNVILATTRWPKDPDQLKQSERFETQLMDNENYWKRMMDAGSRVTRFENTQPSALSIIGSLLDRNEQVTLAIQHEMVDQNRRFADTAAGEVMNKELSDTKAALQEHLEKQIKDLESGHKKNLEAFRLQEKERTEKQLSRIQAQKDRLNEDSRERVREMSMQLDQMKKQNEINKEEDAINLLNAEIRALKENKGDRDADAVLAQKQTAKEIKENRVKEKKETWIKLGTATLTTGLASGLSIVNPVAIPVAVTGGVDIVKAATALFSLRKRKEKSKKKTVNQN